MAHTEPAAQVESQKPAPITTQQKERIAMLEHHLEILRELHATDEILRTVEEAIASVRAPIQK